MPYQMSWYREYIMLIELEGEVTAEDLQKMADEGFDLVSAAAHKVHAIVDTSKMSSTPMSLNKNMSSIHQKKHANQGLTVMVMPNTNVIAGFISSTIMQVLRLEYRLVRSIEEAEATIRRVDPSI